MVPDDIYLDVFGNELFLLTLIPCSNTIQIMPTKITFDRIVVYFQYQQESLLFFRSVYIDRNNQWQFNYMLMNTFEC